MKSKAKKSVLITIFSFVLIGAIASIHYFNQATYAYAETDVDQILNEQIADDQNGSEPNEWPMPRTIVANIHLSNWLPFGGLVYETADFSDPSPFFSISGTKTVVYDDVSSIAVMNVPSYFPWFDHDENFTYLLIVPVGASEHNPLYVVMLPKLLTSYITSNVTYTLDGEYADVSINIDDTYYLCFDANGGSFEDESTNALQAGFIDTIRFVRQSESGNIEVPFYDPAREGKVFAGWYTDPIWGTRIDSNVLASSLGDTFVLYAHWVDKEAPVIFNFSTAWPGQLFHYDFISFSEKGLAGDNSKTDSSGETSFYNLKVSSLVEYEYRITVLDGKLVVYLVTVDGVLFISPISEQRINSVEINGSPVNLFMYKDNNLPVSQLNNVVITFGWSFPSLISVSSDDGNLFNLSICSDSEFYDATQFPTDFYQIFVGSDEYVQFWYGKEVITDFVKYFFPELSGAKLIIEVTDFNGNSRLYAFSDCLISWFNWFSHNSYIVGAEFDGQNLNMSNHTFSINNSNHSFVLNMSNKDVTATLTYDANGGIFAEGQATKSFDVTYGDELPLVDNPVLADNEFLGWFTDPEAGVLVDPENYTWMPWDRWNGVNLYAHWSLNPQPVPPTPPEPVPPQPGPTPVDPDSPGGGAQTGDMVPLNAIVFFAIFSTLACIVCVKRDLILGSYE